MRTDSVSEDTIRLDRLPEAGPHLEDTKSCRIWINGINRPLKKASCF